MGEVMQQEERLAAEPQAQERPRSAGKPAAVKKTARTQAMQASARGAHDDDEAERTEVHDADDVVEPAESFEEADRALALFLDAMQDNVLPDLPDIPGHHVCWLTTTNARDPIARRLRAGYRLITAGEFPEFKDASVKTGEYAGVLGVNEMVAAKIPTRAYQFAMQELHHNRPLGEEDKIRAKVNQVKDEAARDGAPVVEVGDGTAELGKRVPAPRFV